MATRDDTYGKWNLEIKKGRDNYFTFDVTDLVNGVQVPVTVTDYVIEAVIREELDLSAPIIATFSINMMTTQFQLYLSSSISACIQQSYGAFDIKYSENQFDSRKLHMGWGEIDFVGSATA